jgi:endonuclease/exonuclease/phosphatase family metal-dependent hydrolase
MNVLSYNVCWWTMTPSKDAVMSSKIWRECRDDVSCCRRNLCRNIRQFGAQDFIALQEVPLSGDLDEKRWLYMLDLPPNEHYVMSHVSEPEGILSLLSSRKFLFLGSTGGEFEPGRPFVIMLAEERRSQQLVLFVNVHLGHQCSHSHVQEYLRVIENKLESHALQHLGQTVRDVARIVVAGDFNMKIENKAFRLFGKSMHTCMGPPRPTCCVRSKTDGPKNFADYILDSQKPAAVHASSPSPRASLARSMLYPASDHLPITRRLGQTRSRPQSSMTLRRQEKCAKGTRRRTSA